MLAAHVLSTPVRDFSPDKTPAMVNLPYQEVRFPARGDAVEIAAWYIPHPSQHRAVILIHGQNDSRTSAFDGQAIEVAAEFNRQGFNVLVIDLRGHGQSGQARLSFGRQERHDIEGAVDWLKTQGVEVRRLNLAQEPASFVENADVKAILDRSGGDELPAIVVGNDIVSYGRYPTREELAAMVDITCAPADAKVGEAKAKRCC